MDASIRFGTDGWRGRIAEEFTFANVRRLAHAIARYLTGLSLDSASSPLIVGYDTRFLSKEFAQAAAEVLAGGGLLVLLAEGFAPTPVLSYAVVARRALGAVIITASHNPPWFNGVKLKSSTGGSAPLGVTAAIEALLPSSAASLRFPSSNQVRSFDPRPAYFQRLAALVDVDRVRASRIEVYLDPMFGACQGWLSEFLRGRGIFVEEVHNRVDPLFGGASPEPLPGNLGELAALLRRPGANRMRVGFAFDGDGDRLAAMDEAGRFVNPHQLFALLLQHLVEHRGLKGAVVKNFATTAMVEKLAKAYELPFYETPIGFKHIADLMEREDVLIGGEESGGIGVKGHIPERDGMLCALLLLELMAVEGRPLGELLAHLERRLGPHRYRRMDIPLRPGSSREAVLGRFAASIRGGWDKAGIVEVKDLDGLKLLFKDGSWLLLRPSGTEPVLRIYAEAPSTEGVEQLLEWGKAIVGRVGEGQRNGGAHR